MKRLFLPLILGLGTPLGCTTTPYDFFEREASCSASECGGSAGGGEIPSSPESEPGENCESRVYEGAKTERIELAASKNCLVADKYAPLNDIPAYYLFVRDCDENPKAYFTIFEEGDVLELRNESTRFNVDVVFASTDSGTPLFLFGPHELYNQRFETKPASDGTFRLAPLNALTQCLSERGGRIELWPCATDDETQLFSRLSCR